MYDIDEMFEKHQKLSDAAFQPSMNKFFKDADEFFGRTVEEYKQWLIHNTFLVGKNEGKYCGEYCGSSRKTFWT